MKHRKPKSFSKMDEGIVCMSRAGYFARLEDYRNDPVDGGDIWSTWVPILPMKLEENQCSLP